MAEHCRICNSELLSLEMKLAAQCEYPGSEATHAAASTCLDPISLPTVSKFDLMWSGEPNVPCLRGNSTLSTLVSFLYSVRRLGVFIHFIEETSLPAQTIQHINECVCPNKTIVVVKTSLSGCTNSPTHTVYHRSTPSGTVMRESKVLSMVISLQKASDSIVVHWSRQSVGYSTVLSQSAQSMWAMLISDEDNPNASSRCVPTLCFDSKALVRMLPFFYEEGCNASSLVMGRCGKDTLVIGDLVVDMKAQCESMVQRVYRSSTITGRCLCCQYLTSLHEEIHSGKGQTFDCLTRVELHKQFWQKTKRLKPYGKHG